MGTLAVTRRDALKVSALGAAALALPLERTVRAKTASKIASNKIPKPYTLPFKVPPVIDGRGGSPITISQKMQNAVILPGVQTPVFGYNGIAPGPTILARRGTPLSVTVRNDLPAKHPNWGYEAWTSVHLHGSASKPQYDGYASDITLVNGQPWPNLRVAKRKYRFRILNASLSRGLRLQLSNNAAMTVIATDGGLMPKPQTTV